MSLPTNHLIDKRREPRVATRLAVDLGFALGVTRDLSTSGCFIEAQMTDRIVSDTLAFSIFIPTSAGSFERHCVGRIIRVEHGEETKGLAIQITDSSMSAH